MEWWCPRQLDASPVLTRLVDPDGAAVGFHGRTGTARSYLHGTFVLRAELEGPESLIELTDTVWQGRIVRRVRVLRGPAPVEVAVWPGPARQVSAWSEGVAFDGVLVRCGLPFTSGPIAVASTTLDTGEGLVITIDPPGGAGDLLSLEAALVVEDRAVRAWRTVADRVDVGGRWADAAARSALVVHALGAHAPVLAPVTSLPRVVGGERNTDGRVVAPTVVSAWMETAAAIGLTEEADAAATWLAGALDQEPPLPLALDLDGGPPASELVTPLRGWMRSQPVVTGSNAGERISVEPAAAAVAALAPTAAAPIHRIALHADWLAEHWAAPDASIWGLPPRDRHWTSARLAVRAALDVAATAARRRNPLDLAAARWHAAAREIEDALLALARPALPSGVERATDASIVRLAGLGPWAPDDEVVRATISSVATTLGDGLWIYPYSPDLDDGLEGHEPPSVVATLWLARALARTGRWEEAHARVEAAVDLAGPLHLLPESVDVPSRGPLGNRPSAAAHVALIGAALELAHAPA